uniref:Uncharacterized protein n=1 Tax=viral metagenome TaxID=1070528 RepID=A0A6C0BIX6_9ZZZZ
MSSIAKIVEENPHLKPVFDELTEEEKVQLDEYLAIPRMAEAFGTMSTKQGRKILESNKEKSLDFKLWYAKLMIRAILTDPEHRRVITTWEPMEKENEPDPFNAAGSPVRFAKAPAAPPEIENREPKYMMPQPAPRQRGHPQLNFSNVGSNNGSNNGNGNGNKEPNRKKPKSGNRNSKRKNKSKRKTRKN